ncbi:DNA polymerase III subunit delta [Helicobacter sp. MIT 11-5569]|uniref:DNA polymerase III subunit delta' n=1 Tax=Helicobacter sp. MIT 11-5569 TaxID=1548151 RepID=UPI00051F8C8E|nr:DNA polymerase III subunit delta' [Helicobacter sp. MIT 11-5569]TLD83977.1 DNA polymerase III subunit delta [Helicobacter sp. MIT 11-5569]
MNAIKIGHIELVNNPIETANTYFAAQNPQNTRLFCADELDIDTARAIIDESYIASEGEKFILIAAFSFNVYAQNALLKVLEEPPNGIIFVIYAKMKSLLLPTIRSRLPIINHLKQQKLPHFPLLLKMLNLESVYQLLKEREKEFNNPLLKTEIQSLYLDAVKYGLDFSAQETELFEKAMLWETQYENTRNIFVVLLLLVLRKKKQQICATLKG